MLNASWQLALFRALSKDRYMTSRERLVTALNRGVPDRVPRDISWGLAPMVASEFTRRTGESDPFEYFQADHRFVRFSPCRRDLSYEHYYAPELLDRLEINEWGVGLKASEHTSYHFKHIISPLKGGMSENEATDYQLPDLLEPYRHEGVAQEVTMLHEQGMAASAPLDQTIFEMAWQIRGFEELMTDMLLEENSASILLDRITALRIRQAEIYAHAGVDVLMLGDDIGTQTNMLLSPELWRATLKPRLAEVINAARAIRPELPVFYHSDGVIYPVIEDLIEIGVTVLNPIQPLCMDPAEVKRLYGSRLAFWGTIDVQQTLPFGTPEDIRNEVRIRMETIGKGGGLVLGPTHMIEPEVSWENLTALYEAIDEYGSYENGMQM